LIITSLLRTTSSVKSLRERNGNASTTSAHLHATTFDIAAARYAPAGRATAPVDKLKSVLAEVIRDLRAAGRCYARYEYKQTCFHVTAR
jgi:transketolase C-terminal domain/subunit